MVEGVPLGLMSVKVVQDVIQPPSDKVILSKDGVEGLGALKGSSESFVDCPRAGPGPGGPGSGPGPDPNVR
jgi:hypothetical protein